MHTQVLFLPISDHSVATVNVKLLGRFARNRPVKKAKGPPPINRRRLKNDPHVRQEILIMSEDHLRAFFPSGRSSVDDVKITFTAAILQTAEQVAPSRAPRLPGRGWREDVQAEAEIRMAMAVR